jgi:hypothetical protein
MPPLSTQEESQDCIIPLSYPYDLFKSYVRDHVNAVNILRLVSSFVSWSIDTPLTQGAEQDAFLADKKHILMGQVYTSPASAEIKRTILALPLNDLARCGLVALQHLNQYTTGERLDPVAKWIVACACQSSVAVDEVLVRVSLRNFESRPQRISQNTKHNTSRQLCVAVTGRRGPFPGPTRALNEACRDRSPANADNICHILLVFIQLTVDVSEALLVYVDAWRSIENGVSPLSITRLVSIIEDGLFWCFAFTVVANLLILPIPVRRILTHINYEGNILFLLSQARDFPEGSNPHALHYSMYRWTLEAAVNPNTGLLHIVRPLLEKHFELPWLDSILTRQDIENFHPQGTNHHTVRELESRIQRATIELSSDVSLRPIGPRNDPLKLSSQVTDAHMEGICTIC